MSKLKIIDYNPGWPDEFTAIESQIHKLVGRAALRIDHIGSTSVPGLAAKDVIDVQVTVADLTMETVAAKLTNAGYRATPGAVDNIVGVSEGSRELEKKFLREPTGQRRAHVHVREQGRVNQNYPLLFRDFLRADNFTRDAYQTIKIQLARQFPDNIDAYYSIKDPYMDTVYRAAQIWASANGWGQDNPTSE